MSSTNNTTAAAPSPENVDHEFIIEEGKLVSFRPISVVECKNILTNEGQMAIVMKNGQLYHRKVIDDEDNIHVFDAPEMEDEENNSANNVTPVSEEDDDPFDDEVTPQQKLDFQKVITKTLKLTSLTHLHLTEGREDRLSQAEWTTLAQVLMGPVIDMSDKSGFQLSHRHVLFIRSLLRDQFPWAAYIPLQQTSSRKLNPGKDKGYQALLKRKNNYRSHLTFVERAKQNLKSSQRRSLKKEAEHSNGLLTPVMFGTLVGAKQFGSLSLNERKEYINFIKDIRETKDVTKKQTEKCLRLWECTFSMIFDNNESERAELFLKGEFPHLQKFDLLEAYMGKVLQIPAKPMDVFLANIADFFTVWPEVLKQHKLKSMPFVNVLEKSASLYALSLVVSAFGDSQRFMIEVKEDAMQVEDVNLEINKTNLPTSIVEFENGSYGMMAQGTLFIKSLTADQAAFVYCGCPDVFNYNVSKKTTHKISKSELSMEFFRRNFLLIPDATIFKQAFSKLNGSYQILLKRKLLRDRKQFHPIVLEEAVETYRKLMFDEE